MGLIYVLHEHSLEYITNRISPSSMYFLPHIGYACKHVLQRQVLLSIRKKCCWHGWLNWWPEECYVFLLIMWYILRLGNLSFKIFEEILFVWYVYGIYSIYTDEYTSHKSISKFETLIHSLTSKWWNNVCLMVLDEEGWWAHAWLLT